MRLGRAGIWPRRTNRSYASAVANVVGAAGTREPRHVMVYGSVQGVGYGGCPLAGGVGVWWDRPSWWGWWSRSVTALATRGSESKAGRRQAKGRLGNFPVFRRVEGRYPREIAPKIASSPWQNCSLHLRFCRGRLAPIRPKRPAFRHDSEPPETRTIWQISGGRSPTYRLPAVSACLNP
jgi:hypothetical protein